MARSSVLRVERPANQAWPYLSSDKIEQYMSSHSTISQLQHKHTHTHRHKKKKHCLVSATRSGVWEKFDYCLYIYMWIYRNQVTKVHVNMFSSYLCNLVFGVNVNVLIEKSEMQWLLQMGLTPQRHLWCFPRLYTQKVMEEVVSSLHTWLIAVGSGHAR